MGMSILAGRTTTRSVKGFDKTGCCRSRTWAVVRARPTTYLLFYGQSKALVRMMIDDFGAGKMREFMALYKGGKSMDDALTQTYGLDRVALENRWRASVGASPLSSGVLERRAPDAGPGTRSPTLHARAERRGAVRWGLSVPCRLSRRGRTLGLRPPSGCRARRCRYSTGGFIGCRRGCARHAGAVGVWRCIVEWRRASVAGGGRERMRRIGWWGA